MKTHIRHESCGEAWFACCEPFKYRAREYSAQPKDATCLDCLISVVHDGEAARLRLDYLRDRPDTDSTDHEGEEL